MLVWLPKYKLSSLWMDLLAGFTVALTAIPQSIAYGAVAGLPVEVLLNACDSNKKFNPILSFVQYGLYTAFAGPIIYAVFGSVKQITMGPTAVMALMTFQYTSKGGAPYAIVLSFLAGCLEFIAGVLNLGKCLHFFSNVLLELYFLKIFLFFYRFLS